MDRISPDNIHGVVLAVSSSIFIGSSFIIKKKGLKKAGSNGTRAGEGGYGYLYEPCWWVGMLTMLAHFILQEKLHIFEVLGCVLCVVGSTTIVLHAPHEKNIESVKQVWHLATEPGFRVYFIVVLAVVVTLIFYYEPRYGQTDMIVYVGICSLMGSLTVMSVKAVAIAVKLSFSGMNQFGYFHTWLFIVVVTICCILQINYLNKTLDTFNTAIICPVYYVMFTTFTILASMIMFKDWDSQSGLQIATELCGFVTILSGTFLLHKTKDMGGNDNVAASETPVFSNPNSKRTSRSDH